MPFTILHTCQDCGGSCNINKNSFKRDHRPKCTRQSAQACRIKTGEIFRMWIRQRLLRYSVISRGKYIINGYTGPHQNLKLESLEDTVERMQRQATDSEKTP